MTSLEFPLAEAKSRGLVVGACVPKAKGVSTGHAFGAIVRQAGDVSQDLSGCVSIIGAFDGFHLGHVELVGHALARAQSLGRPLVAITFWPDPSETLGHPEGRLMDEKQRLDALLNAGATAVYVLNFDDNLASMPPEEFVSDIDNLLSPTEIHVGENFRFGDKGAGTVDTLKRLCRNLGIDVVTQPLLSVDGSSVSATRIRMLLRQGKLEEAALLMGHYPCLVGTVEHGRGEGSGFGFATANIHGEKNAVFLGAGVYAGYTVIDGIMWPTAANAGSPASFGGGDEHLIEAHLLGFEGSLYGKTALFVPLVRLRGEQEFSTREELVSTVLGNIDWVNQNLGARGIEVRA